LPFTWYNYQFCQKNKKTPLIFGRFASKMIVDEGRPVEGEWATPFATPSSIFLGTINLTWTFSSAKLDMFGSVLWYRCKGKALRFPFALGTVNTHVLRISCAIPTLFTPFVR
jgi:hypothetical protein